MQEINILLIKFSLVYLQVPYSWNEVSKFQVSDVFNRQLEVLLLLVSFKRTNFFSYSAAANGDFKYYNKYLKNYIPLNNDIWGFKNNSEDIKPALPTFLANSSHQLHPPSIFQPSRFSFYHSRKNNFPFRPSRDVAQTGKESDFRISVV